MMGKVQKHLLQYGLYTLLAIFFLLSSAPSAFAAGSRASYLRGGWVGGKYVAMGKTGEVTADDVYAIYWNPAGLIELRQKKRMSAAEIKEKARSGQVDQINEKDLIRFSDDEAGTFMMQVGFSGSKIDLERYSGFVGAAFNLPKGVLGIGGYSILSADIDRRDYNGLKTGELDYIGSAGYLSYGVSVGMASIGITGKCLYEKIGGYNYIGGAADIGAQIYVLPFLKVGFVAQDLGAGLYPIDDKYGVRKKYDFGYPTLRLGIAFISDRGFTIALSGNKMIEEKKFGFSLGVMLDVTQWASLYIGLNDLSFSTGLSIEVMGLEMSYAFTIDNIDYGFNHLVSVSILF